MFFVIIIQLTELLLPDTVERVSCENNKLTELLLPIGIEYVFCENNQITELILPNSVEYVSCDREVKCLDNLIGNTIIKLI